VVGNPKGKITLVEFFDYNCGYCKRALADLVSLMKAEPELRVVLKDFPVLGPNSVEAAQVASAARRQISGDKFLEFHQKLLSGHGPVGREQALAVAKELGLDMDRLQKDSKDPAIRAGLEDVMKVADTLNLTGTPSYVVGNEAVVGAVGLDQLKTKVDAMSKCGKTIC
jgi:protein-disulfide isomerase